jgi:hypothetical protein
MGTRRARQRTDIATTAERRRPPRAKAAAAAALGAAAALAAAPSLASASLGSAAVLPVPDATSAVRVIRPPTDFRRELVRMKRHTRVPILLPATMRVEEPRGHGIEIRWHADSGGWSVRLGIGPRCGGANACFVAYLAGQRGARPAFRRKLTLRGHTRGWFKPSSCGASCAPPQIEWRSGGVLYTIQTSAPGKASDPKKLATLANSAIAGGAR